MSKKQTTNDAKPAPKSACTTLSANGSTLTLLATLKADGTVVTTVTTRDADKKLSKGMTETHPNMEAARSHLASLAEKAEKLGWKRGRRVVAQKPDAFSKLPAPKAVA
jgi:hypothetical protein